MESNEIVFEREKLHQLVWSKPMMHLAKDFNLSDVGLKKICKRLEVPLPEAGYWLKKAGDKPREIPSLPPLKGGVESYTHVKRESSERLTIGNIRNMKILLRGFWHSPLLIPIFLIPTKCLRMEKPSH